MSLMRHSLRRAAGLAVLAALCIALGGGIAGAQGAGATPGQAGSSGMDGKITGAGSGSTAGAAGSTVVDPSNGGVAGTGMGKMTTGGGGNSATGKAPGTGMSVSGPPGQGITNNPDNKPGN